MISRITHLVVSSGISGSEVTVQHAENSQLGTAALQLVNVQLTIKLDRACRDIQLLQLAAIVLHTAYIVAR